ncbi:hypothetical protein [Paraburkholderia sp.]|uniref:hypothetical protein n=1 Tax=Paraburkholderia sp. TaxID=1926495 RepID=UPI0025EA4439|nr:hypothetical protein [Paraburkholderia sp.]
MQKFRLPLIAAISILSLSACGKKEEPSPVNNSAIYSPKISEIGTVSPVPQSDPSASQPDSTPTSQASSLPQANINTPFSQYRSINSGAELALVYYAVSDTPVDYEQLTQHMSAAYRTTSDAFKRKDIVDSLKPKIDAQISAFRMSPYLKVHWTSLVPGHYDMTSQSFPLNNLPLGSQTGRWMDGTQYSYSITNSAPYSALKITDQATARKIENAISQMHPFSADMYLFAQGTDADSHLVKMQMVRMDVLDAQQSVIGTLKDTR